MQWSMRLMLAAMAMAWGMKFTGALRGRVLVPHRWAAAEYCRAAHALQCGTLARQHIGIVIHSYAQVGQVTFSSSRRLGQNFRTGDHRPATALVCPLPS